MVPYLNEYYPKGMILCLCLCLLLPTLDFSRSGKQQNLINLEPASCFLGGSIKISGWVKPNHPGATKVQLEFRKPVSGRLIKEQVTTDKKGNYVHIFTRTDEVGKWTVTAWKAGSGVKEKASFEVSYTGFFISLCQYIASEKTWAKAAYEFIESLLKNYPDFPQKNELLNDLMALAQLFVDMKTGLVPLESALDQLNKAFQQAGNIPPGARQEFIRVASTCDATAQETRSREQEIREVLENSKEEAEWCYIWMAYHDLCQELKFYNNFISTSFKGIAKNLLKAKATEGLDPQLKFMIGKVVDRLTGGGSKLTPVAIAKKTMDKLANLGSKVYDRLLQNCQTFSGEVTGQYKTELLHEEMVFYTMTYNISGKMELAFQKRKPGDPAVYLKGRFKGKAGNFDCQITMVPFAKPDTIGPVYCLPVTPLISRRSFILYLEGKATDDRMELKLEKSGRDFSLKSRAFYILLSSAAYHLPIPGDFSFPLQNAQWFLTRVTKISSPDIEYFQLPIDATGSVPKAVKEFNREIYLPETQKRVGVKVTLKLNIELCSPKCK